MSKPKKNINAIQLLTFSKENKGIKHLYDNLDNLVDIEFANRTNQEKNIWIEPSCQEIKLKSGTEYRILTHDKSFRIEFDIDDAIVFYFQYSFGFKLYHRPTSKITPNPHDWILELDTSEIN